MTGILMDEETGDPVLDEYNNTIPVDNETAFQQIIDGALHCDVGSELMHLSFGFDLRSAIRESYGANSEMFIESLIVQALDSQKEKLISRLDYIKAVKDESNMKVNLTITSILGDTLDTSTIIGD